MRENFPLLTDRPENPAIIGGVLLYVQESKTIGKVCLQV